jgi:hypothetical protein
MKKRRIHENEHFRKARRDERIVAVDSKSNGAKDDNLLIGHDERAILPY